MFYSFRCPIVLGFSMASCRGGYGAIFATDPDAGIASVWIGNDAKWTAYAVGSGVWQVATINGNSVMERVTRDVPNPGGALELIWGGESDASHFCEEEYFVDWGMEQCDEYACEELSTQEVDYGILPF